MMTILNLDNTPLADRKRILILALLVFAALC